MASGLNRRRVPGASSPNGAASDATSAGHSHSASLAQSGSLPSSISNSNGVVHAGNALEGGHRVAYDPRDLFDTEEEGGKLPRLTLLEEVLLLGLKDKQGYLSFLNDNISYALRGCIILELALRRRIAMVKDPNRRRYPLPDRYIEVIDERQTGETLLDEALKMIKLNEKMGVGNWVDLMSGETWNVMKIGFQLKQVRERIAKGLVDKGVLRTEKRNFFLFDMATHPVADGRVKEEINLRIIALLSSRTTAIPPSALDKVDVGCRVTRAVCLVCAAMAASVLENPLQRLPYEAREACLARCDDILAEFSVWPFGSSNPGGSKRHINIGGGSSVETNKVEGLHELVREAKKEMPDPEDLCFEIVASVMEVFSKMDSLL
ncbi:uncharacterized protein EI90DRAFT_2916864 [Cantharellus anzutake]|uniref:uncharacterized protein n=1 Tax=Cantharellus anzutake TaxID=1750568 RepID=UPI001907BEC1|nr:uncharacterized protein EI90DRAFT_2916864 [Cantharellus anzutake]KAF8333463.1 hypothetical protein EI90DRAFT_2916864 [Cantharellus anzutake]